MSATFRTAQPENAKDLAAILRGWICETPWMPKLHTPEEDHAFLKRLVSTQMVTHASLSGRTAGFMARTGTDINCLYLAPFARGQGVGSQMVALAKQSSDRLEQWTFQANTGARRFYARCAFIEAFATDGADNDEKLPDVSMVWQRGGS